MEFWSREQQLDNLARPRTYGLRIITARCEDGVAPLMLRSVFERGQVDSQSKFNYFESIHVFFGNRVGAPSGGHSFVCDDQIRFKVSCACAFCG